MQLDKCFGIEVVIAIPIATLRLNTTKMPNFTKQHVEWQNCSNSVNDIVHAYSLNITCIYLVNMREDNMVKSSTTNIASY